MSPTPTPHAKSAAARRRGWWLRQLHLWHWISSAAALAGLLLFTFTGITLNHAAAIEGSPQTLRGQATLPGPVLAQLKGEGGAALPAPVAHWLAREMPLPLADQPAEWSDDEVYLALPRPGGDAWLRIDRGSGEVEWEQTDRGWLAYLNDLHKGRHTGFGWVVFIDVLAGACFLFALTGLAILALHARSRPSTWPLVGAGVLVPLLVALFFIH